MALAVLSDPELGSLLLTRGVDMRLKVFNGCRPEDRSSMVIRNVSIITRFEVTLFLNNAM